MCHMVSTIPNTINDVIIPIFNVSYHITIHYDYLLYIRQMNIYQVIKSRRIL